MLYLQAEVSLAAYLHCQDVTTKLQQDTKEEDSEEATAGRTYEEIQTWTLASKALNEVVSNSLTPVVEKMMKKWEEELKSKDAWPFVHRVGDFWVEQTAVCSCLHVAMPKVLSELKKEMNKMDPRPDEDQECELYRDRLYALFRGNPLEDQSEYQTWQRWVRFAVETWRYRPSILTKGLNWEFCFCSPRDKKNSALVDPKRCKEKDGRRTLCAFHSLPFRAQAILPMLTLKNSVLSRGALVDKWDIGQKLVLLQSKLFSEKVNGLARIIQKNYRY